jgi:hypothetical protein
MYDCFFNRNALIACMVVFIVFMYVCMGYGVTIVVSEQGRFISDQLGLDILCMRHVLVSTVGTVILILVEHFNLFR